ncbi:MAG: primase small subunit [Methanolobus sp.]|jgi:DNA primase small subunit|uniref:DNA primase catalytic subunit PriS n=1 Tax=Methanolobus sp. TaxID=1874737 RepID=UPI00258A9329|nr:DNA primase catalytic subunit PriS [Methanolobus sp.]MDK2832878.1 primase small subunit [Methanolobus sp.]MDK2938420.1 primase small subunit [Methanolobus sp.]
MDERTRQFVVSAFQNYYSTADIKLPPDFTSREWGFIEFTSGQDTFMKRHRAFGSEGELHDYLRGIGPAHAYYSVAYYEYPGAPKMKEKNWLKADLIFDIDSDHLPGGINSYADMLEKGKRETLKLLEFLMDDFGFREEQVHAVFSGGRGYHFHISEESVLSLGSAERREIVDYVSSKGLNLEKIFSKKDISGDAGAESAKMSVFPSEDDGGWGGRINRYLITYLSSIAKDEDAVKILSGFKGIGKTTAGKLVDVFQDESRVAALKNGKMDALGGIKKELLMTIVNQGVEQMAACVDEPVTADIKRLIRLPGSLHGKSGMKVTALSIDELEAFEPLNDAVVFSDKSVKIKVIKPFAVQMKGKDLMVEEGVQEVPEYAAIYLMCRGVAEYGR